MQKVVLNYEIIIDPVYDVDRWMVQINDHLNEKTHILDSTFLTEKEAAIASKIFVDKLFEKEINTAIA